MKHTIGKVRNSLDRCGPPFVGIRATGTLPDSEKAVTPDTPR
jgi:hypothetical protein